MADEWTLFRLGLTCTKIGSGATPRGGESVYLKEGPVALIRSQNVHSDGFRREGLTFITDGHAAELANVEVAPGDVLLNITGDSVARCCQVDDFVLPARVNQHVAIVRPDPDKLDSCFLRYVLVSPAMQAKMLSWAGSGGTRNALTKGMIESLEILGPSDLDEQRAIGHILATLDDKIELNSRMNETMEAMARAIFKAWFVDFEPVRAKMEGRWHKGESLPGLPAHLYDLFPDRFVDPELGEIPQGWRIGTMGESFRIAMGQSPPGSTYNERGAGLPFYQGRVDFGFRFPTRRVFCSAPTRFAEAGDTLVTVRAPVGDANMAIERCCIGRGVAAVRHVTGSRSYTYYFVRSLRPVLGRFEAEGTVFGAINKHGFSSVMCAVPPSDVVRHFEALCGPLDDQIERNERESRTLAALRDTLLPKLISGELRVPDVNRIVGRVTP